MDEQCNCMGCQIGRGLLKRPDFIAHYGEFAPKAAKRIGLVASMMLNAASMQNGLVGEFEFKGFSDKLDAIQEWCTHGCVIGAAISKGVSEAEVVESYDHQHKDLAPADRAIRRHL